MEPRIKYFQMAPEGLRALLSLELYVKKCGLEQSLLDLVRIRASQINGCAFCIDAHTKDARARDETEQRIYALGTWRETPFYTDRERAALAWTEAVTLIGENHVPEELYLSVREQFTAKELVDLTLEVISINGFNRLAITFRSVPGAYQPHKTDPVLEHAQMNILDRSLPTYSPHESLQRSIDAFQLSQCLNVAARLGIADLLRDGPKHFVELAEMSGADPKSLFRLLRTLASAGVFNRLPGEEFELNEMSEFLCSDSPASLRGYAILAGELPYLAWSHLLHSVKTGGIAFDDLHGMGVWQYLAQNPSAAKVFNEAMTDAARASTAEIVQAFDFSKFDRIIDVGGGQGTLLTGILRANPAVRGVLYDLEPVIGGARELLNGSGISERCETVSGSFLKWVPPQGDAYILKDVLLMWDDEEASRILRNCRQVMKENQIILIIEYVIPSGQPALDAALADMRMMVMTGGWLRTGEEFQDLLGRAGFEMEKVIPTRGPYRIVEGRSVL